MKMQDNGLEISTARTKTSLSPVDVFEILKMDGAGLILDSARNGERSYVCLDPLLEFRSTGKKIVLRENGEERILGGNPFEELEKIVSAYRMEKGGAFGYFSYEMGRFIEELPRSAKKEIKAPEAWFMIPRRIVEFDHEKGTQEIQEVGGDAQETAERIEKAPEMEEPEARQRKEIELEKYFTREGYIKAIEKAKEYIYAGDAFQIVLTQCFKAEITKDPLRIYKILRKINPSPFAGYLDAGDFQIVSCSPERLLRMENGIAQTRPIAGTYPKEKASEKERFLKDIKERAEHVMLVDLERNDLGRVCEPGSVEVDEMMEIEEYSHVMHIVSNIRGKLFEGKNAFDALKACFPGGTITGCPKVRAMEIIDELEPIERGPYTGSLGYFKFNGEADFNIMIRTMVIENGMAYIQGGGGIVADSVPEKEYEETLYKVRALIEAVETAEAEK